MKYNNYDLQTNNIIISELSHEDNTNKQLVVAGYASRDGGRLISDNYRSKNIPMSGQIIGTDKNDLEARIDDLKKNIQNKHNKILEFDYRGGTRTYVATTGAINFDRRQHTINVIGFSIEFICTTPFAVDTTETTISFSSQNYDGASSEQTYSDSDVGFDGTHVPYPVIELTFSDYNGSADVSEIKVENTNSDGFFSRTRLELEDTDVDGKTFIIDTKECRVYESVSGDELFFKDGFPKFSLEDNDFEVKITGTEYTMEWEVNYYKHWL